MENAPYHFFYKRQHNTKQLLKQHVHELDKQQENIFMHQIGSKLYQFEIQDKYSSWTVLKTAGQLDTLLHYVQQHKNNHRQLKLHPVININQFQDKQFQLDLLQIRQKQDFEEIEEIPRYLVKFFEIYNTNIRKITSLRMYKKVRGLTMTKKIQNWFVGAQYELKRIIVTQQGILEMADDGTVTDFLKFDLYFSFKSGKQLTGQQLGIALFSAHRKVVFKALNMKDFLTFIFYGKKPYEIQKKGIDFLGSCRPSSINNINFLIDAENYYREVAFEIQKATKTIYMCGWWISPQLYLIRPLGTTQKMDINFRLDTLLKKAAQRGVKIFIVVFLSPSVIPNDSDHTKRTLAALHPNITVQRHPHQFLPKIWSHHEKAVIIDQKIAFLGGLDLCYGRYDSNYHPVNKNDSKMYPGIDYNNVRIKDFIQVKNHQKDLQQRTLPRMPWHDVAFKVSGKIVADVANHFIQYWNFTLLQKSMAPIVSKNKQQALQTKQNLQIPKNQNQNLIIGILKMAIQQSNQLTNKQKYQMEQFIQNKQKKQKTQKRWRTQRSRKFQLNNGPGQNCLVLSIQSLGLLKNDTKRNKKNKKYLTETLQLLRSASQWSIGLQNGVTQRSIQNAYLKLIHDARHHIYIENQFFISATGDHKSSFVKNQIANALFQRIKKAIQKKQKFKVVIFMPLLPGIEGSLNQKCPMGLKLIMNWQYNTISQSKDALLPRIKQLTDHPQDYIEFYSLRNHGILDGKPVTQLIYIHTKLMIVDDNTVICGSANINDRSQQGDRDSELAVVFTQGQKVIKRLNGSYCKVNQKAYQLRSKLYRQHFGLTEQQVQDPLCQITIQKMRNIAKTNTQTYRTVFGCSPDDNVKKLSEVSKFQKIVSIDEYQKQRKNIIGHAVEFPTMFLSEQNLFTFKFDMVQDIFI